jgi:TRAP-type C4-dicarboxylate transport system permease small subunit
MRYLLPRTRFARSLEGVCDVLTLACGWWLMGLSIATCVEMAGRKLFGFSLQGVDEVGGYTYAVVGAIGFSYALLTRGHVRVDFFVARLPATTRAALNLAATVTLAAMAAFAAYRAYFVVAESIALHATATTPLATPLWVPQGAWAVALAVFAVVALVAAVDALGLARKRAWSELNARHGPQTLQEEIESETTLQLPPSAGEPSR